MSALGEVTIQISGLCRGVNSCSKFKKEIKNFSVSEHKETLVNFSAAAVPKSSNKNWHLTNPEKEAGIVQILFLKNRVINFTCNFKAVTIT